MPFDPWLVKSWPAWFWVGGQLKLTLWLMNRVLTTTGLVYVWKWLRRRKYFWLWFLLIQSVSFGLLVLVFYWLHRHAS